jgi:Haem-NO-binding
VLCGCDASSTLRMPRLQTNTGEEDMHGLIFVTWEKYLSDRFGSSLLHEYRNAIGETAASAPLASRVYDDATLLAGIGAACQLTGFPADTLLWEYGRYFMLNGLTSHLCAYLLNKVHSGRELLLTMRTAHTQMRRTPDGLTPPLFGYKPLPQNPDGFVLIYDSPRKICPVLVGAIEGAAERYGEQVQIVERTCMKQGADACLFEVVFAPPISGPLHLQETPPQQARLQAKQRLANFVLSVLPASDGVTLVDLQNILEWYSASPHQRRPSVLLEAVHHLQHVGLIATTANQPGDDLTHRRYWRAPTSDKAETWLGHR